MRSSYYLRDDCKVWSKEDTTGNGVNQRTVTLRYLRTYFLRAISLLLAPFGFFILKLYQWRQLRPGFRDISSHFQADQAVQLSPETPADPHPPDTQNGNIFFYPNLLVKFRDFAIKKLEMWREKFYLFLRPSWLRSNRWSAFLLLNDLIINKILIYISHFYCI